MEYKNTSESLSDPADLVYPITKSDTTTYNTDEGNLEPRFLTVHGGTGDIIFVDRANNSTTHNFSNSSRQYIWARPKKIMATGTTYTGVIIGYQ